jgi:translation initiation factor eIF-6, putative
MMRLSRYGGNPNIAVYSAANESFAFISPDTTEEFVKDVESALEVKAFLTTMAGSFVVGSLIAMNSRGAVVSGLAESQEVSVVEECLPVTLLPGKHNAAGNNILVNDHGAIVNPDLTDEDIATIEKVLSVPCVRSTIGGTNTVGSSAKVTNKGGICHPNTTDEELEILQKVLKVEMKRTTLNHGASFVGACVLANSKGALVGDLTTPIEMGRLEDALDLI